MQQMLMEAKKRLQEKEYVLFDDRALSVLNESTKKQPLVIRKAMAERLLLQQVPVKLLEGEQLAGLRPVMAMPAYATEEEKDWAWNVARLTPDIAYGHNSPSYQMVLEKGLNKIIEEIDELNEKEQDAEKRNARQAMKISCIAIIEYAERYAKEAEVIAATQKSPEGRANLLELADICRRVPASKPQSFHEALQAVWFVYSSLRIAGHTLVQFGRFDQYMYPFYQKDTQSKALSAEQTKKLLYDFWAKCNMTDYVREEVQAEQGNASCGATKVYMGTGTGEVTGLQETGNNMIVGGSAPDGKDCTNELSYLCLEIAGEFKTRDPIVSVRLHKNSPKKLLKLACDVLTKGTDMPAFYNDEVVVPALMGAGYSKEDAHNYCNDGCIETYGQGKSEDRNIAIWIDALKCLELALNNGMSYRRGVTTQHIQTLSDFYATYLDDGDVLGAPTGEPNAMESFEQLFDAFKEQLAFTFERHVRLANMTDMYMDKIAPSPLFSLLLEGCVTSGKDHTGGGAIYNNTGTTLRGLPNTAESLAAIKKVCFDQKNLSLEKLVEILKCNFDGYEKERALLTNCPKWGDNDDTVDEIAKEISEFWFGEVEKYKNPRGGVFKAGLWATAADHSGQITGASADGRKAGEAIFTNMSAVRSTQGPTSILNSAAKIDYTKTPNSAGVDVHLMPDTIDTEEKQENLQALIRTYFKKGGYMLAFNVVDVERLRKAQENPKDNKDLLVRVHGYSAHFVTLSPEYQELIIERAGGGTGQKGV